MNEKYIHIIKWIGQLLETRNIPYQFMGTSALFIQGVEIKEEFPVTLDVQWDVFDETFALLSDHSPSQPEKSPETAFFHLEKDGIQIKVRCLFNMTIKTDPYRLPILVGETELWCQSLYSYLYNAEMQKYSTEIHAYLTKEQQGFTAENEQAWNQNNYLALVNRYGNPVELASKIKHNPR